MRRLCLLCLFMVFMSSFVNAQSPPSACPPGIWPVPAPFCADACIVDDLDGYRGRNELFFQWDAPPQFCAPQFHAINWVGFVAGTPQLALRIQVYNCQLPEQYGLQVGIYGTTDCLNFVQVSNCEPQFYGETTLWAQTLIPGRAYYLVIDGNVGDICEFEVHVESGITQAPPIIGDPVIIGPDSICVNRPVFFNAQGLGGGVGYYNWELDGVPIGQDQGVWVPGLSAGAYELCVTPSNPIYGNGTTACKTLIVDPLPLVQINEEVCFDGLPFIYQGVSFSATGIYNFSVISPDGCEQPVQLNLTVLPPNPPTDITADICEGDLYSVGGQVFSTSGNYTIVLPGQNGCDSVINLDLAVQPPSFTSLGVVAAELPYPVGTMSIDTSGAFIVVLPDQYGCDSIVAGFLAVITPDTLFTDTTICQGDAVFFNMDTLASSGVYLDTLINADTATIRQLTLTVLPAQDTTLNVSLCQGEEVVVGGMAYNNTGQYRDTLTAANGCDSLITLNLTVLQLVDTIQATICEGEAYVLGNETYTQAGNYDTILTSSSGCQSMVQLQLTVIPSAAVSLTEVRCEGDSLVVGGSVYNSTGVYTDTLVAANGCDSIVTLTLEVLSVQETFIGREICEGEVFSFGGQALSSSGSYQEVFVNPQTGCDSTVNLDLAVLPTAFTQVSASICEGEGYPFGGFVLTDSGQYTETFTASSGCDSIVELDLTASPAIEAFLDTTLCPDDALFVGPYIFREPFEGELQFTGANGCDSILNLALTYHDTITVDTVIIEPDEGDFFRGSIYVELTGGTPPYSYQWSDGRTGPFLDFLPSGLYYLSAADAFCSRVFIFKVPLPNEFSGSVIRRPGKGGSGFTVSPNPFHEQLEVRFSGVAAEQPLQLRLYNFTGQLVYEEEVLGIRHSLRPSVPPGVYWLEAEQDGKRIGVEKVVCVR